MTGTFSIYTVVINSQSCILPSLQLTYADIDVTANPHEPEPAPYPQIPGHIQVQ